jgi:hypothetical protein
MLKVYLDNVLKPKKNELLELESKFGTIPGIKPITRIDYENVIKKLKSSGFTLDSNNYLLRIQSEYTDVKTGLTRTSNIRAEITSLQDARTYCKTNSIDEIKYGVAFVQKQPYNKAIPPVNYGDFNFRITLSNETTIDRESSLIKGLTDNWSNNKKIFRYMNRYSFKHPDLPFIVDLSIVKESDRKGGKFPVPQYTIQDAGVFSGNERYEIEIECVNSLVGPGTAFNSVDELNAAINRAIKIILSGLQETNYPVSYKEQTDVLNAYMKLLWGKEHKEYSRVYPKNFVGPSSYTLQVENAVLDLDGRYNVPNIRNNYTVTDKADGDRKLAYISETGKIYLITTNMVVQFTGGITKNSDFFNSLLDGEHIIHDKRKKFINLYAAFDLYYLKGEDVRSYKFSPITAAEQTGKEKFRLVELKNLMTNLKIVSIVADAKIAPIRMERKIFYAQSEAQTIFDGCNTLLQKVKDGLFEYETDGLIFTPASLAVSSNKVGETVSPVKITWSHSFKWKPEEANTIDFLITTKKNTSNSDYIGTTFASGLDMSSSNQLTEYKTLILRVGFEEGKEGYAYINPCQDIIDDKLPGASGAGTGASGAGAGAGTEEGKGGYIPMQFYPTNPSDPYAGLTNVPLKETGAIEKIMLTEEGEVIEDNMIIECRYVKENEQFWRWVPLRVRYDKTADYRSSPKSTNFGNDYKTANNNWRSLHNPITEKMIRTGQDIPVDTGDDDVYYNRVSGSIGDNTKALRDFHNLFVKKLLITSVAKKGDTLIDLAVGKGGDLPKWIGANLKFVFGVDISRDNIQNRLNGACARYLGYRKTTKIMPRALFVHGNSSINLRNAAGLYSDKDKQITKAVFGQGAKDVKELGKGVYNQYGVAADGFNVCSIQFAIHYMFENKESLHNFLRNVSETTAVGGYFIGTSYDGNEIFKLLKDKEINESVSIFDNENKLLEITKRYNEIEFPDDSSSLGYKIDVFQESINKTFAEYLVNFKYLTRMLENYGFVPLSKDDADRIHMPASTGLFSELFNKMKDEIKRNPKNAGLYKDAINMTAGERKISFLNRYFIYKKVRNVDADKLATNLIGQSVNVELDEAAALRLQKETVLTILPSIADANALAANAGVANANALAPASKKSAVKRPVKQKVKLVLTQEEPEL